MYDMNKSCFKTKDLISRLVAKDLPADELKRMDAHLDDCPKCLTALERIGTALAKDIVTWSHKITGCPTSDELYNAAFGMEKRLSEADLQAHLSECSSCKEEYEFAKLCPPPDMVAPADHKASPSLINATIDMLSKEFASSAPVKAIEPRRAPAIFERASDFLEKLALEATVMFFELTPAMADYPRDESAESVKPFPLEDGRYYFVLSSEHDQPMDVKLTTGKGDVVAEMTAKSQGVYEIFVETAETYFLTVKGKDGVAYDVKFLKAD